MPRRDSRSRSRGQDRGGDRDRDRGGDRDRDRGGGDRRDGDRGSDRGGGRGGSRDRDRDDKDEDPDFKCVVEGPGATPPSRNTENCYRALVEMKKPESDRPGSGTGTVRMTCAWQGDKRTAQRDADALKRAWKNGGFDEVQKVKGQLRAQARR